LRENSKRGASNPAVNGIKKEVEQKIEELKKAKDGDNIEKIKNKTQELSNVIQKIGAELYKTNQEKKSGKDDEPKSEEGEYKEKK